MSRKKAKVKKEPLETVTSKDSDRIDNTSNTIIDSNTNLEEMQEKSTDKSVERTRNFAFLVYPDSAPDNWRDVLDNAHVECLISPLHDKDVNPDGTQKKPHWHVMVMFSSVKTRKQASVLRDAVGGVGWENVASTRGYARYLCHLDNPEKAQYNQEDIVELGGADYSDIIRRATDTVKAVREMMKYIRDNDIMFYSDFVDYCVENRPEWFESLVNHNTYAVYTYIKARSKKLELIERMNFKKN